MELMKHQARAPLCLTPVDLACQHPDPGTCSSQHSQQAQHFRKMNRRIHEFLEEPPEQPSVAQRNDNGAAVTFVSM